MDENTPNSNIQAQTPNEQKPPMGQPNPIYQQPIPRPLPIAPPRRQRRVGTFTLGLALIFIGVMTSATLIFKENALDILRLSPLVLVALGIEVLIYAIKYKDDKLRYDGASIFIVLMLTIVSVSVASVAPIAYRAMEYEQIMEQKSDEIEGKIRNLLDENNLDFYDIGAHANGYDSYKYILLNEIRSEEPTYSDYSIYIHLNWNGTSKKPTASELAKSIYPLFNDETIRSLSNISISFSIDEGRFYANLSLHSSRLKNATLSSLENYFDMPNYSDEYSDYDNYDSGDGVITYEPSEVSSVPAVSSAE